MKNEERFEMYHFREVGMSLLLDRQEGAAMLWARGLFNDTNRISFREGKLLPRGGIDLAEYGARVAREMGDYIAMYHPSELDIDPDLTDFWGDENEEDKE